MNILVVNILIVSLILNILVNLITAELGESACRYSGYYDVNGDKCHSDVVKYLPDECTAYVYDGATCNDDLSIVPSYGGPELDFTETLSGLVKKKPNNTFLLYQHKNEDEWIRAIFGDDSSAEVQKVKDFVDIYPVAGLILCAIETPLLPIEADFYEAFSNYVNKFKTLMPCLKIGFYLDAKYIISSSTTIEYNWFDFSKMNDILEFYIMDFSHFNSCSDELLHVGITPLESTNPDVNTLTKFAAGLNGSTIAKDKVYLEFLINPRPKNEVESTFKTYELSYMEYCENDYDKTWCVDNQDTFYEKGQFAKQHAKGFIARHIDLVDRELKCKCNEDKYITFHMLLNGYKGTEKVTCERLKG